MFPPPGLDAGLFVGRQHAIGIAEGASFPEAFIEIQDRTSLLGKLGISGKDPTSVIPRPNRILRQPDARSWSLRSKATSPRPMTSRLRSSRTMPEDAGQRQTVGMQVTHRWQRLHFNDHLGGKSEAAGLCGEHPRARPDDVGRNVCATYTRSEPTYPIGTAMSLLSESSGRRRGTILAGRTSIYDENISFLLSMRDIWTLGLATFEGANVQEAKLTEHGKMVRDYLNRQTVTQLPDSPTVGLQHRKTLPRRGVVPLTPDGSQVVGLFSEYADNWYKFRIDETSDYIIRTSEPEPAATGVDTVIVLYDSNNNQIGVDDDSGDDTYSVLQKELDAGNYNLRVSSYEGRRGGYTLMVNKRSEVPQKDAVFVEEHERPSDEDVQELSADCKLVGQPLDKDEALWFKLDVTENDKYTIKTSPPKSGSVWTQSSILYANNPWRLLGDDDDGSENALFYSSLVKDLSTGTYYIRVSSFWLEDPGNFQISVCNGQEGS